MEPAQPSTRRRHSKDLKARILAECAAPGASVAAIALSHGLNANLVHRWRRLAARDRPMAPAKTVLPGGNESRFVAVPLATAPVSASSPDIRIELRRGATAIAVTWPVAAAAECGAWLGELLR
jgi:transposase